MYINVFKYCSTISSVVLNFSKMFPICYENLCKIYISPKNSPNSLKIFSKFFRIYLMFRWNILKISLKMYIKINSKYVTETVPKAYLRSEDIEIEIIFASYKGEIFGQFGLDARVSFSSGVPNSVPFFSGNGRLNRNL